MALIKRATLRQAVSVISYVFRCQKCENSERVESSYGTTRKCSKCGEDMQLVSSCCFAEIGKKNEE